MKASQQAPLPTVDFFDNSVRVKLLSRSLTIVFEHPVRDVLVDRDHIIVRVEPPPGTVLNENVFGLSFEGQRTWTIEKIRHVYDDSPFTGLSRHSDGSVWASNWDGASCRLDPKSGAVLEVVAGK
jgi:hypothetical protein